RYRGISSLLLLTNVAGKLRAAGFRVENVDVSVLAERPRLAPHIPTMRERVAEALDIDVERVNVKATTTETLGALGREEGIAAWATCLIRRAESRPGS
ncbi:MAG: 2-C-methyl-D-erythritol 2,4-cyclodiphosphate synthase, partial [Candidatus Bipolaricaulota bacterium]